MVSLRSGAPIVPILKQLRGDAAGEAPRSARFGTPTVGSRQRRNEVAASSDAPWTQMSISSSASSSSGAGFPGNGSSFRLRTPRDVAKTSLQSTSSPSPSALSVGETGSTGGTGSATANPTHEQLEPVGSLGELWAAAAAIGRAAWPEPPVDAGQQDDGGNTEALISSYETGASSTPVSVAGTPRTASRGSVVSTGRVLGGGCASRSTASTGFTPTMQQMPSPVNPVPVSQQPQPPQQQHPQSQQQPQPQAPPQQFQRSHCPRTSSVQRQRRSASLNSMGQVRKRLAPSQPRIPRTSRDGIPRSNGATSDDCNAGDRSSFAKPDTCLTELTSRIHKLEGELEQACDTVRRRRGDSAPPTLANRPRPSQGNSAASVASKATSSASSVARNSVGPARGSESTRRLASSGKTSTLRAPASGEKADAPPQFDSGKADVAATAFAGGTQCDSAFVARLIDKNTVLASQQKLLVDKLREHCLAIGGQVPLLGQHGADDPLVLLEALNVGHVELQRQLGSQVKELRTQLWDSEARCARLQGALEEAERQRCSGRDMDTMEQDSNCIGDEAVRIDRDDVATQTPGCLDSLCVQSDSSDASPVALVSSRDWTDAFSRKASPGRVPFVDAAVALRRLLEEDGDCDGWTLSGNSNRNSNVPAGLLDLADAFQCAEPLLALLRKGAPTGGGITAPLRTPVVASSVPRVASPVTLPRHATASTQVQTFPQTQKQQQMQHDEPEEERDQQQRHQSQIQAHAPQQHQHDAQSQDAQACPSAQRQQQAPRGSPNSSRQCSVAQSPTSSCASLSSLPPVGRLLEMIDEKWRDVVELQNRCAEAATTADKLEATALLAAAREELRLLRDLVGEPENGPTDTVTNCIRQ